MSVTIVGSSIAEEAVGDEIYLKGLVTESLSNNSSISTNNVIDHVLQSLQKRLSKYKYIVQATSVRSENDVDLLIRTQYGAAWESKRDGCITLKYDAESDQDIIYITIYWIYAD